MTKYWNSLLTKKSWETLQKLEKEFDFILIGGWAVFLLTKQAKSKDIDIVINFNQLEKIKNNEEVSKNNRLKRYEIKRENIDIDIYVEHYSELAIPVEDIKEYTIKTQGFTIPMPSLLLILKQEAYQNRKNTVKGEKDLIDILSILLFSNPDLVKYSEILKKYDLSYIDELLSIVRNFKDYNKFNLTPREFKDKKENIISQLRKL